VSKHILIVDLPNDRKCYGCKRLSVVNAKYVCAENSRPVENEAGTPVRPSDCPLIPVDRVMQRMRKDGKSLVSAVNQGVAYAIYLLRDELGLEE